MPAVRAKVSEAGRIELPEDHRKQLGLEHGGDVMVWVEDDEIRIRVVPDTIAQVQERIRKHASAVTLSVDDFLRTRRRDTDGE